VTGALARHYHTHIGGKSLRRMAVILKIIWRVAPAPCGRRLGVSAKRSMSGHHPRNFRESWAEDAKPDKNDCRTGKRISTSCRQNRRGLRHIAIKEHRHLMFKMTHAPCPDLTNDNVLYHV
jgi:hypothetical protein